MVEEFENRNHHQCCFDGNGSETENNDKQHERHAAAAAAAAAATATPPTITTTTTTNDHGDDAEDCDLLAAAVLSRGYVEKDRGRSFPSLWIWMQSNSFRKQPGTSLFFSVARIPILPPPSLRLLLWTVLSRWGKPEFPGFTAAVWVNLPFDNNTEGNANDTANDIANDNASNEGTDRETFKKLIPFATWTGAYFEDLVVDDDRVVATLNSGGIGAAAAAAASPSAATTMLVRAGRFAKAWIGSWFLEYDSRKLRYRLELVADRRVPHVMLYGPKTTTTSTTSTSRMEPSVSEALNARIKVRLIEYERTEDGSQVERVLLDDAGEQAGLEVHQNIGYLMDNLCGRSGANPLMCL